MDCICSGHSSQTCRVGDESGVNLQVINHNALSDALGARDEGSYAQSPLWRADDNDSLGDNDFEQHTSQEGNFEDSTVSHYENYDTIGITLPPQSTSVIPLNRSTRLICLSFVIPFSCLVPSRPLLNLLLLLYPLPYPPPPPPLPLIILSF